MIRRLVVALAVLGAAVLPTEAAGAAPRPERFTACAAVSRTAPRCHRSVTYENGRTVFLRGRITPARPGFGAVLRRMSRGRRFVRVGTIGVAANGRIRWSWAPQRRHVQPAAPYTFVFRVPGAGRSTPTAVWIFPQH